MSPTRHSLCPVYSQPPWASDTTPDTQKPPLISRLQIDLAEQNGLAPAAVRGGLVYEVVVTVSAHRDLAAPELVFDPGWFEGLTINTVEPEPAEWAQRDGRNVLAYGRLAAGDRLEVHLQYQANPTALGRRDQDLALADGGVELVQIDHRATVFP